MRFVSLRREECGERARKISELEVACGGRYKCAKLAKKNCSVLFLNFRERNKERLMDWWSFDEDQELHCVKEVMGSL